MATDKLDAEKWAKQYNEIEDSILRHFLRKKYD